VNRAELHALVGQRICHDLISPLGAIGNGVELLALAGGARGPEMELIAESVENANARLRFFRLAYGGAAPGQTVARAEVAATLRGAARGGRLSYDWHPPGDQPREEVRAVFLLLQCLETALPRGGHVAIDRDGPAWTVAAEGPHLTLDDGLWRSLLAPGPQRVDSAAHVAAHVQFALLPAVLADLGRTLSLEPAADRLRARF
jgi:histidine phosphotransferase ChpT